MSILEFSKEHVEKNFRMVAVLLALLPCGCVEKRALKLLFDDATACSITLRRMKEQRLIAEQMIARKETARPYALRYCVIEPEGVRRLTEQLGEDMHWLENLAALTEHGSYKARGRMNRETFTRMLRSQTLDIFFSLAGANTIYEALLFTPKTAAALLGQTMKGSFADLVRQAISFEPEGNKPPLPRYLDLKGIRLAEVNPYWSNEGNPKPASVQKQELQDPISLQNPHYGIYRGNSQDYVVYETDRAGIRWNTGLLRRCEPELLRQLYYAGSDHFDMIPTKGFPSILLYGNQKELERAVFGKKTTQQHYELGDGTSEFHLVPLNHYGIELIKRIERYPLLDHAMGRSLNDKIDGLSWDIRDVWTPFRYKGYPLVSGFSMDWRQISRCVGDSRIGILCWAWEAEHLRSVLPESRILIPVIKRGKVVEYPRNTGAQ